MSSVRVCLLFRLLLVLINALLVSADGYQWDPWGNWTDCSVTCGDGQKSRSRACVRNGAVVDSDRCESGNDTETANCTMPTCPAGNETDTEVSSKAEYQWDPWGNWTDCSVNCGNGQTSRSRACVRNGMVVDSDRCESGNDTETANCTMPTCLAGNETGTEVSSKAEYHWDPWGNWMDCSVTCGNGQTSRSRACVSNGTKVDSDRCEAGNDTETETCTMPVCPVGGKTDTEVSSKAAKYRWDEWGNWTHCSVTCGNGQRSRTRACVRNRRKVNSSRCKVGNEAETKNCTMRACSGPGIKKPSGATSKPKEKKVTVYTWDTWAKWSACNGTCGKGTKTRSRKCTNGGKEVDFHMKLCAGNRTETKNCTLSGCPGQAGGAVGVTASTVTTVMATIVFIFTGTLLLA